MCVDCWNAAMGLPAAAVAGRFAWVGYRDRIPFLAPRRSDADADPVLADDADAEVAPADDAEATVPGADRTDEPVAVP